MKVTLVTCLSADWQQGREPDPYIPLGLLCLGAGLEEIGVIVEIIDQTLAIENGRYTNVNEFYKKAARLIADSEADVVGFTTMCNSYPQTVELARHLRQIDPHIPIIFGGSQATAADVETLEQFPWVDTIVRGEADRTFPELIACLRDGQPWTHIPGLTYRVGDQIQRNPDAPLVCLDELPMPAYHLYPLDNFNLIPIDTGRGCPFECTFCSTNLFFKRRYRMKSPGRLVEEIIFLQEQYNNYKFDFVHDMFTVNKKAVAAICEALRQLEKPINWGCSARADCVTPELLADMASAGCFGMFFGLESGSPHMQRKMRKKLNPQKVPPIIQCALELGIDVTTSFIAAFPEETEEDLFLTLDMILDFVQMGVRKVQLHMLAPLVGSPLYYQYKDNLQYDGHCSDISTYLLTDEEVALVENHPIIFSSFYHAPTRHMDREKAKSISAAVYAFPELLLLLRQVEGDIRPIFNRWTAWCNAQVDWSAQDYYSNYFGLDFCQFLSDEIAAGKWADAPYLRDYVTFVSTKYGMIKNSIREKSVVHTFTFDAKTVHEQLLANGRIPNPPQAEPKVLMFTQTEKEIVTTRIPRAIQRLLGVTVEQVQPVDSVSYSPANGQAKLAPAIVGAMEE